MSAVLEKYRLPKGKIWFSTTEDGKQIRLALWKTNFKKNKGTVFFLNGHREFIEKYTESFDCILRLGFNLITLDWRGWGLSQRPFRNNPKIQHISDTREYQYDLNEIIKAAEKKKLPRPWTMLAHSMGCLIGLRKLSEEPHLFDNYIFLSPLWGNFRSIPHKIQNFLIKSQSIIRFIGLTKITSENSKNYRPYPLTINFNDNTLTSDYDQFMRLRNLLVENPEIHSGTPTLGYLIAVLKEIKTLKNIVLPKKSITVFIAENEQITDNTAVKEFVANNPFIKLIEISNAKHELLIENKAIRQRTFKEIELVLEKS